MFSIRPVDRLSAHTTSSPRATRASQRCEPIKPAPPVTRVRILDSLLVSLGHGNAAGHWAAYSKTADRPTSGFPLVVGQGVTSIEQAGLAHNLAEQSWVNFAVL